MLLAKLEPGELRDPDTRFAVLEDLARNFAWASEWGYSHEQLEAASRELGVELPESLIRWYTTVGRVRELTSTQNHLRSPEELAIQDGVLVLYDENQNCTRWGVRTTDLSHCDPPIVLDRADELRSPRPVWQREADSASSFALSVALTELVLSGHCGGEITPAGIDGLRRALREVPVQPLRWPQEAFPCWFLVDSALVIMIQNEFIFMAAKESGAPEYIAELAGAGNLAWDD